MIREFGKFSKLHPAEKLFIVGKGELKKKMQEEIIKLANKRMIPSGPLGKKQLSIKFLIVRVTSNTE